MVLVTTAWPPSDAQALDAASEIERLRTALQKIAYPEWGEYPSDEMVARAVVKIARAALKEQT